MAAAKKATATKDNNTEKKTKTGSTGKKTSAKTKSVRAKNPSSAEIARTHQRKIDDVNEYRDKMAFEMGVTVIVLFIAAVFLYISYFGFGGTVGRIIGGLTLGIFGWLAWILPIGIVVGYIFAMVNRGDKRVPRKLISLSIGLWLLAGLSDLVSDSEIITEYYTTNHVLHKGYFECMNLTFANILKEGMFNTGLLGRFISGMFTKVLGVFGAGIIMTALFLLCLFVFHGMELMAALRKRNAYRQEMEETYEQIKDDTDYKKPSYRVIRTPSPVDMPQPKTERRKRRSFNNPNTSMQAVDLRQMHKRLDELEKKEQSRKAAKKKTQQLQNEISKEIKDDIEKDTKEETVKEMPVKNVSDNKTMPEVVESENVIAPNTAEESTSAEKDYTDDVEKVPIYREELNQKFRGNKKRNSEDEVELVRKETRHNTFVPGNEVVDIMAVRGTDNEARESLMPVTEETEQDEASYDAYDEFIRSEAMAKEIISEKVSEKDVPVKDVKKEDEIASEADTDISSEDILEDDTEVLDNHSVQESDEFDTDESYDDMYDAYEDVYMPEDLEEDFTETAVTQIEGKAPVHTENSVKTPAVNKGVAGVTGVSYKRPEETKNHGKIGGENYVSQSDTFNALNESKVAEQTRREYSFPPIDLLGLPEQSEKGASDEELRETALKLQETLKSFNVKVKMGPVTCGPTVTRYELLPAQGVRVNKITNLADDLKLSLAAPSIRIEAPIPGKAAVGIEVPNAEPSSVHFRELLEGEEFKKQKSPVTFAVGKDIAGKLIMTDIAKMPHLLIAGATGSGKSVCINTLIMSILYKANPDDVKLIMIDPKVVELSVYNGIPHLFCPVVTDPKEAAAALNWAVREMMDRYDKFKELGVRNIAGYNEKIKTVADSEKAGYKKMPLLVIIVDEFADLMMVASKEVEDAVCRIAQLARAAGIHLVLATQRPSVNVITGVIKANIPSRIAFSVSSAIDSRTILDRGGAEKLLGKGDMLFFPSGYSEPMRVQGAFVSDKEVSDIVEYLCNSNDKPEYNDKVTEIIEPETEEVNGTKDNKSDRDDYFEDAGRFVIESDRAAAGQLQRRFSIGFNRAGRIIDQLHQAGVVGPAEGTKPRKILMSMQEFDAMLGGGEVSDSEMGSEQEENYDSSYDDVQF